MSEQGGYGEGRPDVEAAMRRATRTERPTRRTRPVATSPGPQPFARRPAAREAPATPGSSTRVKLNFGEGPVLPLFMIGTGMYLAWFGVHYWRSDVKWPTDPVKALLQGKSLPDRTPSDTAEEQALSAAAKGQISGASAAAAVSSGGAAANAATANQAPGVTPGTGTPAANQNTGKLLAAPYGWSSGPQWDALVKLWNRESGWSNTADTRKTGLDPPNATVFAYGIAQARPYNKYPKAGWPPDKGGQANPNAQIAWGLAYIKSTYQTPEGAWAHEESAGWY